LALSLFINKWKRTYSFKKCCSYFC